MNYTGYEDEMQDAEENAKQSLYAEMDYISSLGICNGCNNMGYDMGDCMAYKMPLRVIGGRKKKCKQFDNTPQPQIEEDWRWY